MKKVFMFAACLILMVGLSGCSSNNKLSSSGANSDDMQNLYGTYTFEEVSYLSHLSSSTADYLQKRMSGTKFTVDADLFKIESAKNPVEINSPKYVKEEIPNSPGELADVRSVIGNEAKYQYTILKEDGSKTHWRLYFSSDSVWIAWYNDNIPSGSEVVFYVYRLTK